ncbi:kelch-like protein 40a [Plakobranchus ocellatus]|uniref:Kelch-like protein 40a n=1 Tax=Plakobranchus ocellatus TaxID=259542 RepID=A0AAV4ATB3_9GAST|nr:kelch-like protein 40a [Plakobranchus ocellatus]
MNSRSNCSLLKTILFTPNTSETVSCGPNSGSRKACLFTPNTSETVSCGPNSGSRKACLFTPNTSETVSCGPNSGSRKACLFTPNTSETVSCGPKSGSAKPVCSHQTPLRLKILQGITLAMDHKTSDQTESIASNIAQKLPAYRTNLFFTDITVIVGAREFKCHRLILSFASEFFQLALTSDMKESREGKITLPEIEESVFSTILTCIYCGEINLTEDNLLSVWAAAHMLQITFIMTKCERFFENSITLNNCFEFLLGVRLFSPTATQTALDFIALNFDRLRHLKDFNRLDSDEMKYLISREKLKLEYEDDLIEVLLRWAENLPSDGFWKSKKLAEALECTRYLLISKSYLTERLSCHRLVNAHPRCKDIVDKISRYHSQSHLHQEWCPPAAMHRRYSKMVNVFVSLKRDLSSPAKRTLHIFDPSSDQWVNIQIPRTCSQDWRNDTHFQTICHDGKLYFHNADGHMMMYWPEANLWKDLGKTFKRRSSLCAIGDWLFSCSKGDNGSFFVDKTSFQCLHLLPDTELSSQRVGTFQLETMAITNMKLTSIENTLIIFLITQDKTYIIFFDILTRTSTNRLSNEISLPGRIEFVTMRRNNEVFILQENGQLWRLYRFENAKTFQLKREKPLWNEMCTAMNCLQGAALVNEDLQVVTCPKQFLLKKVESSSLAGVFKRVVQIIHPNKQGFGDKNNSFSSVVQASLPNTVLERGRKEVETK